MQKKLLYLSILAVLALVLIGPEAPADDPAQEPEAAAEQGSATPDPAAAASEAAADATDGAQALETFIPSEKLPADSAISFPVDI